MRDLNPWGWQDAEIASWNRRHNRRVAKVMSDPINDQRPPLEPFQMTEQERARQERGRESARRRQRSKQFCRSLRVVCAGATRRARTELHKDQRTRGEDVIGTVIGGSEAPGELGACGCEVSSFSEPGVAPVFAAGIAEGCFQYPSFAAGANDLHCNDEQQHDP